MANHELTSSGREGLSARISALGVSLRAFEERREGALDSIRRLVQSAGELARKYDLPELSEALRYIESKPPAEIPQAVGRLLVRLHTLAACRVADESAILVVDDDPDLSTLISVRLSEANRRILVASSIAEAEAIVADEDLSLILLDLHLPDSDGRHLLMKLREDSKLSSVPIIVISSDASPESQAECFALGADEFFQKPFDIQTLAVAVSARLRRSAELWREAQRDPLTGLPNRAALERKFDEIVARAKVLGQPTAIAILDFDHFKEINDRFGHSAGDDVLRRASAVVAGRLRSSDFIARWGGDEIVILLPATDPAAGAGVLTKLAEAICAEDFAAPDGTHFTASIAAGVAAVEPGVGLEAAVAVADRLLYQAKAKGTGVVAGPTTEGEGAR